MAVARSSRSHHNRHRHCLAAAGLEWRDSRTGCVLHGSNRRPRPRRLPGRLTNAFSKKLENHVAAVSLHFAYYNFCRKHQTLGTTPAVAAGVTDHVWKIDEIIGWLEAAEATPIKRGSYKPRQPKISN